MHWPLQDPSVATTYSPMEVIQGLTEYYTLLSQTASFPPDTISLPPSGGWSDDQLDVKVLKAFKRSDAVIDLLRHIPYLNAGDQGEWQIWPESFAVRYLRGPHTANWLSGYKSTGWAPAMPMDDLPPHIATLTTGHAGSTAWIVDTNEGLMYGLGSSLEVHDHPADKPWMHTRGYPIAYFFEMAKADLLNLTNIPTPIGAKGQGPEITSWEGKLPRHMRQAYHEHGWPDLSVFDRDACAEALVELRRADEKGRLADTGAQEDEMELDDEDSEEDDDYEYQERDAGDSEYESDEAEAETYLPRRALRPLKERVAPQSVKVSEADELREELEFLKQERQNRNWGHIDRAAGDPIFVMGAAD